VKILLTGAAGQLGNELYPLLSARGEVLAADINAAGSNAPDCRQANLGDPAELEQLLGDYAPDLVVNAAAYTAVDKAEEDQALASLVNETLPARLATWARQNGSALVHYSTDYVFDGSSSRPYLEEDPTGPLSVYGATKLAGERAVRSSGCRSLILRTSWVYSSHGHNFVLSMLRLARSNTVLRIVDDQVGCPTWAHNLARVTAACLDSQVMPKSGGCRLFHYSDSTVVSWHGFAVAIFEQASRLALLDNPPQLEKIDTAGYPQAATRPGYSVLDTSELRRATGFEPPGLSQSLMQCLEELIKP